MCFDLDNDLSAKPDGHVAHLDRNASHNSEDNLAYLCLRHHAAYDSKTPHAKGFLPNEIKVYRSRLYEALDGLGQVGTQASTDSRRRWTWKAGMGYCACFNALVGKPSANLQGLIAQTQPFLDRLKIPISLATAFEEIHHELSLGMTVEFRLHAEFDSIHGPAMAALFSLAVNIGPTTGAILRYATVPALRATARRVGYGLAGLTAVLDEAVPCSAGLPTFLRTEWFEIVGEVERRKYDNTISRMKFWREHVRACFDPGPTIPDDKEA